MPASVWYSTDLTCCNCESTVAGVDSSFSTYGLSPEVGSVWLGVSDALLVDFADLVDAFEPTAKWPPDGPLHVLEYWWCPTCGTNQAVELVFVDAGDDGWRLVEQQARCITDRVLVEVNGVSARLRETLDVGQLAVLNGA